MRALADRLAIPFTAAVVFAAGFATRSSAAMKLEVGKTYLTGRGARFKIVEQVKNAFVGYYLTKDDDIEATGVWGTCEHTDVREYVQPPKTYTGFIAVYPENGMSSRTVWPLFQNALSSDQLAILEVSYCEDGTASVKVHPR